MTTIPTITALPSAPSTDDPTNFATEADALLAALPTLVTEENLTIAAMNTVAGEVSANAVLAQAAADAAIGASDFMGICTGSLNIATGSQTFTQTAGLAFANTYRVTAIKLSGETVRMRGEVTAYNSGTGSTTVTFDDVPGGGGSASGWAIILSALEAVSPNYAKKKAVAFAIAL